MKQSIGRRIRELRNNRNLSVEDFATQLQVNASTVYNWEQGKNLPASELLPSIATILNTTIDNIFLINNLENIRKSISSYYFDLDLADYVKAQNLASINSEEKLDPKTEFMMLSMEVTNILHHTRDLIVRLEDYIKDNPDLNQHMLFQSYSHIILLRILFYGPNDVLEQLKSEEILNQSLMTQYKLIRYYLITGQSKIALDLCEEVVSNYSSPELDILLAECQWKSGNLDLASDSLWKILQNRYNYKPLNIIIAHETLYRIYLKTQNYKDILELLNFSMKWLPDEYAKCGHDPELAKKQLDNRFKRFTDLL